LASSIEHPAFLSQAVGIDSFLPGMGYSHICIITVSGYR
jgi:hypothetical protein